MDKTLILGTRIDNLTVEEAVQKIAKLCSQKTASLISTPNVEFIINAKHDNYFRTILNHESKLNLPDGIGLLWAAKFKTLPLPKVPVLREIAILLEWVATLMFLPIYPRWFHHPLREKISGSDFIWPLAKMAAKEKLRLFLLGGAPTVAERVALKLQTDIYGLRIAGVHSGSPDETEEIIDAINKSKADILLVAFGSPKQEIWLNSYLKKTICKIGMGVGGTFDFIAGVKPRAPFWMRRVGLEWLFRLAIEPHRWKRQLAIPKFIWLVLIERFRDAHTRD